MKLKTRAAALGIVIALAACSKKEETVAPEAPPPLEQVAPQAVAYISHQSGPVTIYSLADYAKIGEIAAGEGARGVGLTADGKLLVIAMQATQDLAIVDTATKQVVRRVPLGNNPIFLRVLGHRAFVAYAPAHVAIVDLIKGEIVKTITTGFETEGMEFSADGEQIIVTNRANDANENVSVHSIETGEKIEQIDTENYGIRPRGVKRSPNGEQFVVTLEYSNKMLILDKNYDVTNEVPTGEVPHGVTYNRDGSEIVVALARGKAIQVFDSKTLELIREMPVGEGCWHFSFTPDDTQLIVACGQSNNILVLDYATGTVVKEIPEESMPWGVVVSPTSVSSLGTPE